MKPSKFVNYLDFKELTCPRNLVIIMIFFVVLLGLAQIRINDQKEEEFEELNITNKLEKLKVEQFDKYKPYGAYGIRLFTIPSPMDFLSGFKIYNSLIAIIDHGTKLNIYETKKGHNIFPDPSGYLLNFTGLLLIFGSLLVMLLGYEAFSNEKELKLLCTLKNYAHFFTKRITSRMIFITIVLLFLALMSAIQAWANGLKIPTFYFLIYWAITILIMNFFLFLGTLSGALKTHAKQIITFICLFLGMTVFSLLIIVKLVKGFSNYISEYQTEYDKLRILMALEKKDVKRFGNIRTGEEFKNTIKDYLENKVKIPEDMESHFKQAINSRVKIFRNLSSILPSTYFLTSVNELVGSGYDSYFDFYGFVEKMKSDFIKFFFEKEYFTTPIPGQIESFIKGDENIYRCRGSLPPNFWRGILLTLLYSTILLILTHQFTYLKIFPVHQHLENEKDLYIRVRKGQPCVFFTKSGLLRSKIYNHLSRIEKLQGEIAFDPDDDLDRTSNIDVLYLPDPDCLKHITASTMHYFLFGHKPENNMETWEVLLNYAMNYKIVIFDDFFNHLDPDKIDDIKHRLAEKGIYSITLTSDYYLAENFINSCEQLHYLSGEKVLYSYFKEKKPH